MFKTQLPKPAPVQRIGEDSKPAPLMPVTGKRNERINAIAKMFPNLPRQSTD